MNKKIEELAIQATEKLKEVPNIMIIEYSSIELSDNSTEIIVSLDEFIKILDNETLAKHALYVFKETIYLRHPSGFKDSINFVYFINRTQAYVIFEIKNIVELPEM